MAHCHDGSFICHHAMIQVVCADFCPQMPQNVTVELDIHSVTMGDIHGAQHCECEKKITGIFLVFLLTYPAVVGLGE